MIQEPTLPTENGLTAKQTYTNVNPNDEDNNG
jgi:hypothetical protein